MPSRPIVIAGAGIGGLTAALALAARGHSIIVGEKATALQAVGAGVQLSPNASRILISLGLGDALAARAFRPAAVVLNSVRAGAALVRLPLPQIADAPYWVMHRADLQAVLAAAASAHPAITLRLGCEVTPFFDQTDGIDARVGDETITADALIGADGVGSRLRQALFPGAAERASGRSAWRGLTSGKAFSDVQLWMGPHAHLVAYPAGTRTNLVVTLPDDSAQATRSGDAVASVLARAGWPDPPCALVASAGDLTRYPLRIAPPLRVWSKGRATLLGDAAHAMLPFAAQGAAMAIEDAAVLAGCFNCNEVSAALARYSQARMDRVTRVAQAARQSGRIYHLNGPIALVRDLAIRTLGGQRLLARQNWIYGWTP